MPSTLVDLLTRYHNNVCLFDETGHEVSYGDVLELARSEAFSATRRRLVFSCMVNEVAGIQGYLALLVANAVPMMVNSTLPLTELDALIDSYKPDYLWIKQQNAERWPNAKQAHAVGDYVLLEHRLCAERPELPSDLALLLSTSGTTGSRKYVRLSHQNIWSNAAAIADYLNLTPAEVAITTLPPSYSYGLSIVHSHLLVGAGLAISNKTFFDRDFWTFLRESRSTSLAGVPYHYEILKKLRFTSMELPHLRTLTQAGGRMNPELTREYATHCQSKGIRFFTMYGQTEASPRMSYVPAEQSFAKAGTIGIPIPGGSFELQAETGANINEAHVVGELVYRGPNVCLGYAECRADLSLCDINRGVLHTGDLAERDDDGYYRIVGRQMRFIKLFGNRVNLQDVESLLSGVEGTVACSGRDDLLEIYLPVGSEPKAVEIKRLMMASLRVGAQAVAIYGIEVMPRNESGKVRYSDLHPEKARRLA